jgi:hypothetical protein
MTSDAFQLLQKHLPDAALRPLHLQMLRASLQAATTLAPDRWTLTCNKTSLRVNVGMIEVGAKNTPFMASISPALAPAPTPDRACAR